MANTEKFIDLTGLGEFKSKMDLSVDGKVGAVSDKIGTVPAGSTVVGMIGEKADASTTYTKTEVDTAVGAKADAATTYTKTEVDTAVGAKADTSLIGNVTSGKTVVEMIEDATYDDTAIQAAVSAKADAATTYTKTEVDTAVGAKANAADVYTKTQIDGMVSSAMHYKGTVATYSALPTTNVAEGDMYNVTAADATNGVKAGDNVAWNGTGWDVLSGVVDLSNYATTTVTGALDDRIDALEGASLTVATQAEIDGLFA